MTAHGTGSTSPCSLRQTRTGRPLWQLDFFEFETTTGRTWRLAGHREYWSKYEHPFHVRTRVKLSGQDASRERCFGMMHYERLYLDEIDDAAILAQHIEVYRVEYNTIRRGSRLDSEHRDTRL